MERKFQILKILHIDKKVKFRVKKSFLKYKQNYHCTSKIHVEDFNTLSMKSPSVKNRWEILSKRRIFWPAKQFNRWKYWSNETWTNSAISWVLANIEHIVRYIWRKDKPTYGRRYKSTKEKIHDVWSLSVAKDRCIHGYIQCNIEIMIDSGEN